ncbi:MAG: helix-turn-helix domain-containing protein [Verrucomicrobia bacterium]|nr:helix-turn-helix domain-containing protein [Verrucomicrobiota bacterium]
MKTTQTTTTAHSALPERLTYKINECAAIGGVSHQTIRRAIARGDIRVNRKTRHLLVPRTELERFLSV